MANIQLVANLARYRKSRGMTQKELGEMLNISRQAYSNYETGKRTPDIDLLLKIAQIYDITLDLLVSQPYSPNGIIREQKGPFQPGVELLSADTIYLTAEEVNIIQGYRAAENDVRMIINKLLIPQASEDE